MPQYSDIKDYLTGEWENHILMNSERIFLRLKQLNEYIIQLKNNNPLVESIFINESYDFYSDKLEWPILKTIRGKTVELNSNDNFSKKMINCFESEVKFLSKPEIMIIMDPNAEINKESLNMKMISIFEKFDIKTNSIEFNHEIDLCEEFFINKNPHAILYLINTELKGSDGRYNHFKDITFRLNIPNKVIKHSTLTGRSDEEFFHIIRLNLLGIMYRFIKKPFWTLNDIIYDIVLAYTETVRMNGYINIISIYKIKDPLF